VRMIPSVSIPYRYATNTNPLKETVPLYKVSIPYRYATNTKETIKIIAIKTCFNPL